MLDASRSTHRDVFVLDEAFGLLGRLDGVGVDREGEAWGVVHCGTFGARTRLVPLRGAHLWSGYLRLTCRRDQVRSAPEARCTTLVGDADALRLRAHYADVWSDESEPRFHHP